MSYFIFDSKAADHASKESTALHSSQFFVLFEDFAEQTDCYHDQYRVDVPVSLSGRAIRGDLFNDTEFGNGICDEIIR